MKTAPRILIVEDNPDDELLLMRQLKKAELHSQALESEGLLWTSDSVLERKRGRAGTHNTSCRIHDYACISADSAARLRKTRPLC